MAPEEEGLEEVEPLEEEVALQEEVQRLKVEAGVEGVGVWDGGGMEVAEEEEAIKVGLNLDDLPYFWNIFILYISALHVNVSCTCR